MELLWEFLFELLFEGGMEIAKNRRVSKWIRYPIIIVIGAFFAVVLGGLFLLGILLIKKSILGSIFILALDVLLITSSIRKFIKFVETYKNEVATES